MGFIRELREVEAHGTTKLHVIHTNDLQKVEDTVKHYEKHLKYKRNKIVGVDVEYTNEQDHKQNVALIQLSVSNTHPVLLFQLSVTEDKCTTFDNFLLDQRYTFAGFSIDQDFQKLERVGVEISHFVDIHKEWTVSESTKYFDSFGDVSSMIIDNDYIDMTYKLTVEDHRSWERMPLFEKHIEYASKDTYAAYEIWGCITLTQDGLHHAKLQKSKKHART